MNSDLLHYLNKYFIGDAGVYENTQVDIATHFREKFGVNIKRENGLFQFKYNQLEAKFCYPLVKECRGHILAYNNGWKFVSRPFDKFFNQHEGYCPIFDNKDFVPLVNQLTFVEKLDGSCIQVFFDFATSTWRATTLGTITSFFVGEFGITFSELFWKTIGIDAKAFETYASKEYTYVFELACAENRIVTQYPNNFVALLGTRNNETGEYLDRNANEVFIINELYEKAKVSHENLRVPHIKFMFEVGIKSLEDAKMWIEKESEDTSKYGNYAEGFVIYNGCYPVAKMKNMKYVSLHSIGGGDIKHSVNASIDAFFLETIDDIYDVLPEPTKVFIEALKKKIIDESQIVYKMISEKFAGKEFANQKDYAMCVLSSVDKKYSGFFFGNKEKILDPKTDVFELFRFWLKSNYSKFDWKSEINGI